jgi:hypothetical protein
MRVFRELCSALIDHPRHSENTSTDER